MTFAVSASLSKKILLSLKSRIISVEMKRVCYAHCADCGTFFYGISLGFIKKICVKKVRFSFQLVISKELKHIKIHLQYIVYYWNKEFWVQIFSYTKSSKLILLL